MYLKNIKINNFRKFGSENNVVEFVDAESYEEQIKAGTINVAPTTTLIVGKNNCGKSTIIQALIRLIQTSCFTSIDFNLFYLKDILEKSNEDDIKLPYLEFEIVIGIDKNNNDLITNLSPFLTLESIEKTQISIIVRYEVEDAEIFKEDFKKIILTNDAKGITLEKYIAFIDEEKFVISYYNTNMERVKGFKLNDLIEITAIGANIIRSDACLSDAFNKIVEYRYKNFVEPSQKEKIENCITSINAMMNDSIAFQHNDYINSAVGKIISSDKMQVLLSSDVSFNKLIENFIKYEYVEKDIHVPETQFGLGYTNLMMIIASLIDYMEKYPETSFNSKVNLISIEEPETYMHPQMQELFMNNINDAINVLLEQKHKNINTQLIITTHSAHIVNSKIHSGNTFNNINYVTIKDKYAEVISLNDNKIINGSNNEDNLKFIKKHIKFKVSELFFSDAVILVEGASEYSILPFYINKNEKLNKFYISVFCISGAHALIYIPLLKLLQIPTVIFTDADIKRCTDDENFKQMKSIKEYETTNETLIKCLGRKKINSDEYFYKDENIYFSWQNKVDEYSPTSFEEAFILTNYDNDILNTVLKEIKPIKYNEITKGDYENNKKNSYKWQKTLKDDKTNFANTLLYHLIVDDKSDTLVLPKYIDDGLEYINQKLNGEK